MNSRPEGDALTMPNAFPRNRRWGTAARVERHPGDPVGSRATCTLVTPVVRLLAAKAGPFGIDGDLYHVEDILHSGRGPRADVVLLRGRERREGSERKVRRAIQVRDLEKLVSQGRVEMPFGSGEGGANAPHGPYRGGRPSAQPDDRIGGGA